MRSEGQTPQTIMEPPPCFRGVPSQRGTSLWTSSTGSTIPKHDMILVLFVVVYCVCCLLHLHFSGCSSLLLLKSREILASSPIPK